VGNDIRLLHYNGNEWSSHNLHESFDRVPAVGLQGVFDKVETKSTTPLPETGTITRQPIGYYDIWGSHDDHLFVVGFWGDIVQYDGNAWRRILPPLTSDWLYGVWGNRSTDIYAVGDSGTVLHYSCLDSDPDALHTYLPMMHRP
jgi:hypothetical protein